MSPRLSLLLLPVARFARYSMPPLPPLPPQGVSERPITSPEQLKAKKRERERETARGPRGLFAPRPLGHDPKSGVKPEH